MFGRSFRRGALLYKSVPQEDEAILKPDNTPRPYGQHLSAAAASEEMLYSDPLESSQVLSTHTLAPVPPITFAETARLSLEFCILWFLANYFVGACLEYTTVASSTILTSTSSVFTLLFGTLFRVEVFTLRKLLGVLASLAGIALISSIDLSGSNDDNRGSFPHKTVTEIALGDGMALISAVLYGVYAVFMKKRIGDETRVNMPVFFGLVGLFNVLLLWPGFLVLHFTGLEKFELPPDNRVVLIILVSLFHDVDSLIGPADDVIDQQCQLVRVRSRVGLCGLAHIANSSDGRAKYHDPAVSDRTDCAEFTARQSGVLAWCVCGGV